MSTTGARETDAVQPLPLQQQQQQQPLLGGDTEPAADGVAVTIGARTRAVIMEGLFWLTCCYRCVCLPRFNSDDGRAAKARLDDAEAHMMRVHHTILHAETPAQHMAAREHYRSLSRQVDELSDSHSLIQRLLDLQHVFGRAPRASPL